MRKKQAKRAGASRVRIDRDQWLAEALEVLSREGNARITVRNISESLGVTTGSFYWHFENREDFVDAIVDFWDKAFTEKVAHRIRRSPAEPREQLLELMKVLTEENLGRYDIAVRAWATHDNKVAKAVRKVDRQRFETVRGLFAAMGFVEPELDMRTRTFVVFFSLESAVYTKQSKRARLAAVESRHIWFTRP